MLVGSFFDRTVFKVDKVNQVCALAMAILEFLYEMMNLVAELMTVATWFNSIDIDAYG